MSNLITSTKIHTIPGKNIRISNSEGEWGVYWKTGCNGCNRQTAFFSTFEAAKAFAHKL